MNPLVSILLLMYQHEEYVEDAINGILHLDYSNIELVILDDASTDDTVKKLKAHISDLEKKCKQVKLIVHEKNSGCISKNINELIKNSNGEFIIQISADDIMMPDSITSYIEVFDKHPEVTVTHANAYLVPDSYKWGGYIDKGNVYNHLREERVETDLFEKVFLYQYMICSPAVCIRRDVFGRNGNYDESIFAEDYDYWVRISQTEKFYYLNRPLTIYRRGITSITNYHEGNIPYKIDKMYASDKQVIEKYISNLKPEYRNRKWQSFFTMFLRIYQEIGNYNKTEDIKREMLELGIKGDDRNASYQVIVERLEREERLFEYWIEKKNDDDYLKGFLDRNGYKTVAIYGYAVMGRCLYRDLKKCGTQVTYIIDQYGNALDSEVTAYTIDDILPDVDVVIVTPIGLYESVVLPLSNKVTGDIINLADIIMDL